MPIEEFFRWAQLVEWVLLALAALNLYRQRRDRSAAWLAVTFTSLALVVLAGVFIGEDTANTPVWETKALILLIVLFPYLLFRFLLTIVPRVGWTWWLAHVLTIAVAAGTIALPYVPQQGDPQPGWFRAWVFLLAGQWAFLLGRVAFRLWQSGRGQPPVATRRMQTMALGAFLLAAVLVVSAFGGSGGEDRGVVGLVSDIVTLFVGPLFWFGFAPPGMLRAQWRRREETALREMEVGLVKAVSRGDIARALLPVVVNLLGGSGAALVDDERKVIGKRGLEDDEIATLIDAVPDSSERYAVQTAGAARVILMENGWLVVVSGPFTPFFGSDELQMLAASAVFADLALGRARLYELESQSREAMRDFVAIASHDLRTPVTVIQGFSQLMNEQWDTITDENRKEFAAAIERQTKQLDRLVTDLLTVSRLDVNEIDRSPEPVDLCRLARENAAALAPESGFTVETTGSCIALADKDHVTRMLQNYIKNATVYGSPPFTVDVEGERHWVTVTVSDEGVGVPPSFVPHLFEKFARVDKKKSKSVQGTGLGLSIVRGLARANGGDAWYTPNVGGGSRFAFRLPAEGTQTRS